MLIFVADDHYKQFPGRCIYEEIASDYPSMIFKENDWSIFTSIDLAKECDLLILHMIAATCNLPIPDEATAESVKKYCQTGKNLLLLHGSSAAFWPYKWFREISGLRWVRPHDPDDVVASFHPHEPYKVVRSKCRHPLVSKLVEMDFPSDEIYTGLEQTQPLWTLMTTTISTGTFPQCTESLTPWGGRVINFLPGHIEAVTRHPDLIANVKLLINDLCQ